MAASDHLSSDQFGTPKTKTSGMRPGSNIEMHPAGSYVNEAASAARELDTHELNQKKDAWAQAHNNEC